MLLQILELVKVSDGIFEVFSVIDDGGKISQSLLNLISSDEVLELNILVQVLEEASGLGFAGELTSSLQSN